MCSHYTILFPSYIVRIYLILPSTSRIILLLLIYHDNIELGYLYIKKVQITMKTN